MKGSNSLILCEAEMIVALQEYINKRMNEYAPIVKGIKFFDHSFTIIFEEPKIKGD